MIYVKPSFIVYDKECIEDIKAAALSIHCTTGACGMSCQPGGQPGSSCGGGYASCGSTTYCTTNQPAR